MTRTSLETRICGHLGATDLHEAAEALVAGAFPESVVSIGRRDVYAYALTAGLTVTHQATALFDGKFETSGNGHSSIELSILGTNSRRRFTLAHELAHWLLRRSKMVGKPQRQSIAQSTGSRNHEERLADIIAGEILMPRRAMQQILASRKLNVDTVRLVAKKFDVSFKAAMWRVVTISDVPFMYVSAVPHRFRNTKSYAEVDEAVYFWPDNLCCDRHRTRFLRTYNFADIMKASRIRLALIGSQGRVVSDFEVKFNARPFPNCDLLTELHAGVMLSSARDERRLVMSMT